ncbi:MAG TPA: hypothetical protein VJT72_19495 [Pseudonocardiaceae bacterium]|nr:hypothetical protein [Pseudonocardiaceae bacterium]
MEINYDNSGGPSSAGTIEPATAICDEGWWAIGGGARTIPSNNPSSLKPIGSFPSNTSGTPAADDSTNPRAWTAVGLIGSPGQNGSLTEAYAICTNDTDFAVTVQHVEEMDDPETASTANSVTATCPTDRALFSGGALAEEDDGAPQQGVHPTGTFPSNNSGTPASDDASVDSWTAVVQTGGMAATGTDSHAFALCETSG